MRRGDRPQASLAFPIAFYRGWRGREGAQPGRERRGHRLPPRLPARAGTEPASAARVLQREPAGSPRVPGRLRPRGPSSRSSASSPKESLSLHRPPQVTGCAACFTRISRRSRAPGRAWAPWPVPPGGLLGEGHPGAPRRPRRQLGEAFCSGRKFTSGALKNKVPQAVVVREPAPRRSAGRRCPPLDARRRARDGQTAGLRRSARGRLILSRSSRARGPRPRPRGPRTGAQPLAGNGGRGGPRATHRRAPTAARHRAPGTPLAQGRRAARARAPGPPAR